jgi:hypothetical protein
MGRLRHPASQVSRCRARRALRGRVFKQYIAHAQRSPARFPPYQQVIPKVINVDRMRCIDALRRAQLMSSETRGVKVAATKDGMTITSDNPRPRRGARSRRRQVRSS